MNKYYVTELYEHAIYTAGKSRYDIELVLNGLGYQRLIIDRTNDNIISKVWLYILAIYKSFTIKSPGIVFLHFPVRSRRINLFLNLISKRNIYTIAHIHDFEGIRGKNDAQLDAELSILKRFKAAVVLNQNMKEFTASKLPFITTFDLILYDYIIFNEKSLQNRGLSNNIAFAGNLSKASFINHVDELKNLKFHVYGKSSKIERRSNVLLYGEVNPINLPFVIQGSFGLVWDGNKIDTCSGNFGAYLQYNLPHKLALYIAAGLPIIIWDKSALANFIAEERLGFAVSSLHNIAEIINALSEQTYNYWVSNVMRIREKIIHGNFYESVVKDVEENFTKMNS